MKSDDAYGRTGDRGQGTNGVILFQLVSNHLHGTTVRTLVVRQSTTPEKNRAQRSRTEHITAARFLETS